MHNRLNTNIADFYYNNGIFSATEKEILISSTEDDVMDLVLMKLIASGRR